MACREATSRYTVRFVTSSISASAAAVSGFLAGRRSWMISNSREVRRISVLLLSPHIADRLLTAAEGLSYDEAAQVCGVAVGTIKSRVGRARERLARLLALEDAEDLGPDRVTQAALQTAI